MELGTGRHEFVSWRFDRHTVTLGDVRLIHSDDGGRSHPIE